MSFSAQKCGICFHPPAIILIYRDNSQDKTRQRIMPVRNFSRFSGELHSLLPGPPGLTGRSPLVTESLVSPSSLLAVGTEGLCWGNAVSPRCLQLCGPAGFGESPGAGLGGGIWEWEWEWDGNTTQSVWAGVCWSCCWWLSPDCSTAAEQLKNNPRHRAYLEGVSLRQLQKLYTLLRGHLAGQSLAESLEKLRQEETIDPEEDLNKLEDRELARKKSIMDELFEKNRKKKGDPGFVYNVEVDFPQDEQLESCGWDLETDEEI